MSVPPRRATPALLQVDAILVRLTGTQARAEIARFLSEEFPPYRWVGVYRRDGDRLRLDGESGRWDLRPDDVAVGDGPTGAAAADGARSSGATDGAEFDLRVPVRADGATLGVLAVHGTGGWDPSDLAFLGSVATRLGTTLRPGPGLTML